VIPVLPADEALERAKAVKIDESWAKLNAFRTMLNSPRVAGGFAELLRTLMFHNVVNSRARELVILRIGWRTKSEYEFCQHVRVSRELKISEAEILGVRDPDACQAYSAVDRAVIKMADELHETATVSPSTWGTLAQAFSNEELIELVLAAGLWRMVAGFFNAAKVPLDEWVPSWPEGKAPA
jgi:alkylhydroperoxidase family enzyme